MNYDPTTLTTVIYPRLVALVALILGATISGVIVAVRDQAFEWRRLGDFMRTMVVPKLGGWLLLELLAFFTSPATVPDGAGVTHDMIVGLAWAAYTVSFASLIGQLLANLYELGVLTNVTRRFSRPGGDDGG